MKRILVLWLILFSFVPIVQAVEYSFARSGPFSVNKDCTLVTQDDIWVNLACIEPKAGYAACEYLAWYLLVLYPKVSYDNNVFYFYGDIYGGSRYTCMVYAPWNETHLINVNRKLVVAGKATMTDFTLNEWPLYKEVNTVIPEFPSFLTVLVFMALSIALVGWRRKNCDSET